MFVGLGTCAAVALIFCLKYSSMLPGVDASSPAAWGDVSGVVVAVGVVTPDMLVNDVELVPPDEPPQASIKPVSSTAKTTKAPRRRSSTSRRSVELMGFMHHVLI
jgi:hypothetical protein